MTSAGRPERCPLPGLIEESSYCRDETPHRTGETANATDELDKELERRGHRFVRYADDCNIYVKSQRSGQRVLASITGYLRRRLKLTVNEEKSAVGRPWERVFLGFSFTRRGQEKRLKVSEEAIRQFKYRIHQLTCRTRGRSIRSVIGELAVYLRGWKGYYGFAQVKSPIQDLEKWVRRKPCLDSTSCHWGYRTLLIVEPLNQPNRRGT